MENAKSKSENDIGRALFRNEVINNRQKVVVYLDDEYFKYFDSSVEFLEFLSDLQTDNYKIEFDYKVNWKKKWREDAIRKVHEELKERKIHPSGKFDVFGRFWIYNEDLINVVKPTKKHPYSQMKAGRTLKYVRAVAEKYHCDSYESLVRFI